MTTTTTTPKRRGGARAGAGAKRQPQGRYSSAFEYLLAVARGIEPASPEQRVAAARACLPFERPKTRATMKSPRPTALREQEAIATARDQQAAWRAKADKIRKRHEVKP